ncbi:hypothetical protein NDU88_005081 [Pleurodeles waltl]|uniref:Uncharacterized protein n=1 Tax=Pleurodeles waltl TaxID=8319 RepID=A0AAV7WXS7_PLEWA|nr:hypothetical protein NDU88_005081 [Pleurodeles waltl]
MEYYTEEDEYYQDQPDTNDDHHMEERLVEALGYHDQDSVNQALINALKPFAQPLRRLNNAHGGDVLYLTLVLSKTSLLKWALPKALRRPMSSADILAHMAASVLQDHGYGSFSSLETPEVRKTKGSDHSCVEEDPREIQKSKILDLSTEDERRGEVRCSSKG